MLRSPYSPAAVMLVLLMAVGSVVMWIGVPLGLIYLASQLADSSRPSVGPYLLVLIGLPVGMAIVGKCLGYARSPARPAHGPPRGAPPRRPGCARCAASGPRPAAAACSTRS